MIEQLKRDKFSMAVLGIAVFIFVCIGIPVFIGIINLLISPQSTAHSTAPVPEVIEPAPTPTIFEPEARQGIGITRGEVQTVFENLDILEYEFAQSDSSNGQPRFFGLPSGKVGRVAIELVGPPENLTRATAGVLLPDRSDNVLFGDIMVMGMLLETVIPDWKSGPWLFKYLDFDQPPPKGEWQTTHKDLRITLTSESSFDGDGWLLTVTIDPLNN